MNRRLDALNPYPFERLAQLTQGVIPPEDLAPIRLSIGEPQHAVPEFILDALRSHLDGANQYPSTRGLPALRDAIALWLTRRFKLPEGAVHPAHHVLPCSGTREALFAVAQALIEPCGTALALMPNPFYQIYEGAAILAGAQPYFLNAGASNGHLPDFDSVTNDTWDRCQLIYLCTPANPSGAVLPRETLERLIHRSIQHDFVIVSDECYSELYRDESDPPPGLLEVAAAMGHLDFSRLLVFHSLSKRSNMPGLRSGFIAGDARLIERFFLYRTYHGAAMPLPTQRASIAAWSDEAHVTQNRALYRQKFDAVIDILKDTLKLTPPPAGFYLWPKLTVDDQRFTRALLEATNVAVLPGSYLSRSAHGENPGEGHIRIALVPPLEACIEAAQRIRRFIHTQSIAKG